MQYIEPYLVGFDEGARAMIWTCAVVVPFAMVMLYADILAGKYQRAWIDDVGWDANHSGIAPRCVGCYAWSAALLKTYGVLALAYVVVPWLVYHVPENYMRTDEGLKSGGMVMVSGFLFALLMWKPIIPYAADAPEPDPVETH